MPFTPYHMGPATVIKAGLQEKFSLTIFGFSQIIIDLQPLYLLLTGEEYLIHGVTHTYTGATLLFLVSAGLGKPICEFFLQWYHWLCRPAKDSPGYVGRSISWRVAFLSAAIGTYSHVVIDSIMHADMKPLFPVSETNVLLRCIPVDQLHEICVISGFVGTLLYLVIRGVMKRWGYHEIEMESDVV